MREFPRPRVVVSRCLLEERCRYDGEVISCAVVERLRQRFEWVPVCPEMEIGLPVPREPIDVVLVGEEHRLIQRSTGRDLTADMERFCRGFLETVGKVDGFVLKARSPSCGVGDAELVDRSGEVLKSTVNGRFAEAVLQRYGRELVETEAGLEDPTVFSRFVAAVQARVARRRGVV